ncbi:MAG TPA: TonB-dependent receptor [Vicinamibacteria bacterium]|nr:TonB-dependent receptor [Vicinamibacteria bacterium]
MRSALFGSVLLVAGAAGAFEGRVVRQQDGSPVAGAEVTVLGRTGEAFTDAEGRFTFVPDPALPFEILVILPGGRIMKPVLIESFPEDGLVVVEVQALVQESVTVTAGTAPSIEHTPAAATTLLPRSEVQVRLPVNLGQALENVPGVATISEGRAEVPVIRGLARGRTLLLIDGARVTAERRVGPSATFLDPFVVDSLEVSRGPGSVAYGSDAFGGVIQVRTRRPEPSAPFGMRFIGSLGAGVPQGRAGVEVTQGFSNGGVLFQAHYREFDDYDSPEGTVFNSGSRDQGYLGKVQTLVGSGVLSFGFMSDLARDVERPRTNSHITRFFYPTEDSHRFTAGYDRISLWGLSRLNVTTFVGSYRIVTDQDTFATENEPRRIERADVDAKDYAVRAVAEKLFGGTRLELGVDLNGRFGLEARDFVVDYDLAGNELQTDERITIENGRRVDTGLFASLDGNVHPKLQLVGGGRVDRVTTHNEGGFFGDRDTANGAFSGFAAATVGSFGGWSFTGQIARGFRDPVISDRYFRGVTGRGFITGNPDLEPETATQFDTAVRYTSRRWRAAIYYYHYRFRDLIERYEDEPDFFFFRNRGRALNEGVELELQAELGRELSLQLSAYASRGKALDDDAPLDDVPPTTLTLQLRRELSAGRGYLQVRGAVFAEDDEPGPSEVATPGYGVVDFSAGWEMTSKVGLRFLARNLTNTSYPVSTDRRAVPAPGISAVATVVVTLGPD